MEEESLNKRNRVLLILDKKALKRDALSQHRGFISRAGTEEKTQAGEVKEKETRS